MQFPYLDLGSYDGRRDGSPGHVAALVDSLYRRQDAHVRDWEDHVLSGPYADMLVVTAPATARSPAFRVISSAGFAKANYGADYTIRPMTTLEMWLAMKGDDRIAADLETYHTKD